MARLFGALANAGAQVNTNRFKRQQYDDQQAAQAREEARRVFEFAALRKDRQEQAKAAAQEREQARLFQAQEAGYADAPDVAGVRAGGAAMAAMGGFHTNAEQAVAQEDAPFQREVEGVQYQAPKVASQYLTIGGKTLRKNRQSEANAAKDAEAQKFMAQVVMNKDIKSQLQMQRDIAAGERADAANQTREIVAGIAAASRQQGQQQPKPPKTPTGSQEQSYLYSKLLEGGNATMEQFKNQINPNKIGAYVNSKWMKPALTPEEQQFVVGARDFAAGVLRKESGAAIKDEELRDVMARYIDMPLDAPATRELKRKNRTRYEQSMHKLAMPARAYYGETDEQDTEPDATVTPPPKARPKAPGAPTPNRTSVPWETKK